MEHSSSYLHTDVSFDETLSFPMKRFHDIMKISEARLKEDDCEVWKLFLPGQNTLVSSFSRKIISTLRQAFL